MDSVPPGVVIYPAPPSEPASADYTVTVNGRPVFVHNTPTLRGFVSFASFDFEGQVTVAVTTPRPIKSFKLLPASYGLPATATGNTLQFDLARPCQVTLELNGQLDRALHLFANPLEAEPPQPGLASVIHFGPGLHEISTLQLASHTTLYLAGGAIVRAVLPDDEEPTQAWNWKGNKSYAPLITGHGVTGIHICGRGILDLSRLPWQARRTLDLRESEDIVIEGITFIDSAEWTVSLQQCRRVTVRNIKQISRRENSDGIDISNSQDVLVEDCFLRNNDDEICVKTLAGPPAPPAADIVVRNCVIWNERARALGITNETRADISNVLFQNCDILHDLSDYHECGALVILVSDSGTMRNIRFESIRVEDVRSTLFLCWIGADMWGHDDRRGRIREVVFRDISACGHADRPVSRLHGCDAGHQIDSILFDNVRINGKLIGSLAEGRITVNEYVQNIRFA